MSQSVTTLQPQNILDGITSETLRHDINTAISQGAEVVLVDCQNLSYMDSSGLGTLVLALKAARAEGRRLALCSLNQQVKLLFELTDMLQIFEIYTDHQEFDRQHRRD